MQVEFYFSDSNLPNDGFLRNKVREDADGFVPIALICSFSKMRAILGIPDDKKDAVPKYAVEDLAEELKDCADLEGAPWSARFTADAPVSGHGRGPLRRASPCRPDPRLHAIPAQCPRTTRA